MSEPLSVGQMAPDFTLTSSAPTTPDDAGDKCETVSLRDYRGKNVVLVFYPADWSSVCGDELAIFSEMLPLFQTLNAQVLGISVDGVHCHQAFIEARRFGMPLLSDFEPKGEVARSFGVYDAPNGCWITPRNWASMRRNSPPICRQNAPPPKFRPIF